MLSLYIYIFVVHCSPSSGNSAIVQHDVTGYLYDSPEDFISIAERFISDSAARTRIGAAAKEYIQTHHSLIAEEKAYVQLLQRLQQQLQPQTSS